MQDFLLIQQFLEKYNILTAVNHFDECHVTVAVLVGNHIVESAMENNRAKHEHIRLKAKEDIVL